MGWLEQQREKQKREAQARKLASEFARGLDTPSGNPLFDSAYWAEVGSGVMDAINRGGVAGLVGAPVDIVNTVMRPIGLGSDSPVMGSEWIGEKMRLADIVSDKRNPIAETLAGLVDPATITPFAMKAAALGIPALAAFGATAIGSKANKGAKLSKLAQVIPKQRGIFAGVGAKTANLDNLDIAQKLKQQGVPDELIWKQTGWTLDTPDKIPRFEIPDNKAMYRGTYPSAYGYADTAMHHPELMQGYPDVGGIRFESNVSGIGGDYANQGAEEIIRLGANEGVDTGSTALHELQHAIQQREGFARGGSPESMANLLPDAQAINDAQVIQTLIQRRGISPDNARQEFLNMMGRDAHPASMSLVNEPNLQNMNPMDAYRRLAGEAEARLTQARMNMTPEERLANYPYQPEYFQQATGVPLKDLIVRKDGGTAMSVQESLFDTAGLPNRGRELIQSKAEEYAQRLRDAGVNVVDVQHSGSAAGPSSYIKVQGFPDIRISGHSKGVFGTQGVVNVGNDAAFEDVLTKIPKVSADERMRILAKQKEEEIATMYPIRIKSALKKLAKGKSLTNSEQDAIDWLKNQKEYQ